MNPVPFHRRPHAAFLSHAHVDGEFVGKLYRWLTNVCGLSVWYDAEHMPPGQAIAAYLDRAVLDCRALLIVYSHSSIKSGWVEQELRVAKDQRNRHRRFRIVGIRIDDVVPPEELQIENWLEAPGGVIGIEGAVRLLAGLHGDNFNSSGATGRDIYVSRGWDEKEEASAACILKEISKLGLRPIGDSREQENFDGLRIKSIMETCVGHVWMLPRRGEKSFSTYMQTEFESGHDRDLPQLLIADTETTAYLPDAVRQLVKVFDYDTLARGDEPEVSRLRHELAFMGETQSRAKRAHSFFATDFGEQHQQRNRVVKSLVQGLTALPCITGHDVQEGSLQSEIIQRIGNAYQLVADISEENVNTCVEAGIARALGTRFHLVSKGPVRKPVFMFRDNQVRFYENDLELIGLVHRAVYTMRRWVM